MKNLQAKIQKMLEGERKRREVAICFLEKLTEEIEKIGEELWGKGESKSDPTVSPAAWLWKEDGSETSIYFRYRTHYGSKDCSESPGFYFSESYIYWGDPIAEEKGKDFWWAIRTIIEWLPLLAKKMEEKEVSRDKLVERIEKMLAV